MAIALRCRKARCRKPHLELLFEAARRHAADLLTSGMIGDEESDIDAGLVAGCHTVRWDSPERDDARPSADRCHAMGNDSARPATAL
jgi:histidinol phosphatase-like enzyme